MKRLNDRNTNNWGNTGSPIERKEYLKPEKIETGDCNLKTGEMTDMQKEVISAWAWIRKNNSSIPDDVLDLMKNASLEALEKQQSADIDNPEGKEEKVIDMRDDWDGGERIHMEDKAADIDKQFTSQNILDEIESDLLDGCMPVGEVESCLIHWRNKYLITDRGVADQYENQSLQEENKKLREALEKISTVKSRFPLTDESRLEKCIEAAKQTLQPSLPPKPSLPAY